MYLLFNTITTIILNYKMPSIDISEVKEFVKNKTYDEIVYESMKNGLCVKYSNDDNLKGLYLLANKNEETSLEKTKLNYQANGVILEKETNNIVAMCQNQLYDCEKVSDILKKDQITNQNARIEYCEDGTMMRLYNYNDNWYTSTTRCIDARTSYWTSYKSFDELFWMLFDKNLLVNMDKNYTYVFILLHKENRIVIRHKVNMLVYVSRIHNTTYTEDYTQQFNNVYGIRRPKKIDICEYLNNDNDDNSGNSDDFINATRHPYKRGILIKILNKDTGFWDCYKKDYENYIFAKDIRGNVPQIRMRYLELLNEPAKLEVFEKIYSENKFMFNVIKTQLFKLAKTIHQLYINSHVKHQIEVKDDNMYYKTLRQLHAQYKTTNNPIVFDEVRKKVCSMNANIVKKLLMWE